MQPVQPKQPLTETYCVSDTTLGTLHISYIYIIPIFIILSKAAGIIQCLQKENDLKVLEKTSFLYMLQKFLMLFRKYFSIRTNQFLNDIEQKLISCVYWCLGKLFFWLVILNIFLYKSEVKNIKRHIQKILSLLPPCFLHPL